MRYWSYIPRWTKSGGFIGRGGGHQKMDTHRYNILVYSLMI